MRGSSKSNPILACGPADSYRLVAQFRCADGSCPLRGNPALAASTRANVGSNPDGHVIDRYAVPCSEGTRFVFVDMYGCPPWAQMQARLNRALKEATMSTGNYEMAGCVSPCGGPVPDAGLISGLGDVYGPDPMRRPRPLGTSLYRISPGTRTHVYAAPFFPQGGGPTGTWDALPWGSWVKLDPTIPVGPPGAGIPVHVYSGVSAATGANYRGRSGWLPSWVHLTRVNSRPLLGFGDTDTNGSTDFLSLLGQLAIPVLVVGAGVYIGSKLAKVANRKANRRRNKRKYYPLQQGRQFFRNPPYRVSYMRDFDVLGTARSAYGELPGSGYASVRDLGKGGSKLKGGGRWRSKLVSKRGAP